MSKSGLFGHFGSKQDLQLATVEAAASRFREAVVDPVRTLRTEHAVARDVGAYIAYLESTPTRAAASGSRPRPSTMTPRARSRAIVAALDAWLGELERQARTAGVAEPERLAFELYALVMGANSRYRLR